MKVALSALLVASLFLEACVAEVPVDDAAPAPQTGGLAPARTQPGLGALQGAALRDALFDQVQGHHSVGYSKARQHLLGGLDAHGGALECIYTGKTAGRGVTFNIEHSWPQSRGASREPAKSDLHHLFVSESRANSARGNHLFGDTSCDLTRTCSWATGDSELGRDPGNHLVFEVRPARRGDIARAQFYFAVRYELAIDDVSEPTLRDWNDEDPPDADEMAKNDGVEAIQHNRNPFVDDPSLVAKIGDF